jgi:hypothetical protein
MVNASVYTSSKLMTGVLVGLLSLAFHLGSASAECAEEPQLMAGGEVKAIALVASFGTPLTLAQMGGDFRCQELQVSCQSCFNSCNPNLPPEAYRDCLANCGNSFICAAAARCRRGPGPGKPVSLCERALRRSCMQAGGTARDCLEEARALCN